MNTSPETESDDFRDLLDRWEELRERGEEPSVDELCRDAPHLAQRLREWTRVLSQSEWLSRRAEDVADETVGEARATRPVEDFAQRTLGEYVLIADLGGGGMGRVYKAVHRRLGRPAALKLLVPSMVASREAVERFEREVHALARLDHPNIVAIHDAGEADGTHFFAMDLVEGDDLARLVRESGPMPVEQAVDCILQTAQGLDFAHAQGIVHRDIKPSNLMLDQHGTVKILDLGIARLAPAGEAADELTKTGCVMGTVDYMAPEQALNTRHADHRADIYALGCTLWYLLTGDALFGGETVMERLVAHREHPLPSLRRACPAAPAWLEAVFQKMAAKRPADRYQTVAELMQDLKRQTAPKWASGWRPWRMALAAAALLGLALLAWWAAPWIKSALASRAASSVQSPPSKALDLPVKPSWRATGEYPLIAGVWRETAGPSGATITIAQQGGDFTASGEYREGGQDFAWRGEGKVSRSGHFTMSLAYTEPESPADHPPQTCTAVLSPGGHTLEGYAVSKAGKQTFAWKLAEPREAARP